MAVNTYWANESAGLTTWITVQVCIGMCVCFSVCGSRCGFAHVSVYASVWQCSDRVCLIPVYIPYLYRFKQLQDYIQQCTCACVCVYGCGLKVLWAVRTESHCQSGTAERDGRNTRPLALLTPSLSWVEQAITASHMAVTLPEGDSSNTHTHPRSFT